jgi:hypothetical protein
MKNKHKKQLKVFSLIGLLLVLGGLVIDILIKSHIITKYIIVSDNYILYVFSLIFTVATLGCTLLSIIVGVSNNRVLGLQLREIVSLGNSPLKIGNMIVNTFSLVILSIPLLAIECNTAITLLAIILIVFIIRNTVVLCKIVFNNDYTKRIVLSYLDKSDTIKSEYIQYWITSLYTAINENNIADEEELLSLLNKAARSQSEICNQIGKQIFSLFSESYKHQSFVDSYRRILRLNDPSKTFFDERTTAFNYIKNLKYQNPEIIDKINLAALIEDIIICDFLSDEEKTNICYWFFSAILDNNNIIENDKLNIVYNGFCALLWLDDDFGSGQARVKTAIILFRNKVLLAEDFEYGKKIYIRLIKAIYTRNQYRTSKYLSSLLSQIVRMIYFWSFLERETLSESRRNLIETIPDCFVETMDNASLSISFLIERHHEKMVEFLIKDVLNPSWSDPLDYFPDLLNGKALVCTPESKIKFALWFYSIWGYGFSIFPIKLENADSHEKLSLYKSIYTAAFQEFELSKNLTDSALENVQKMQRLFHKTNRLPQKYLSSSYDNINSEIAHINDILNDAEKCTVPTIRDELFKRMNDHPEIPVDETINLDHSTVFQFAPLLCYKRADYNSFNIYYLQSTITSIVNTLIDKRLQPVAISFDINGVNTLKNVLRKNKYSYRNYTFYDDWGLDGTVRKTDDYKELVPIIDAITYKRNSYIHSYLFLNVDDIKLNYSIEEMRFEELEGDVLEEYLAQYRVADEQYNIDGAVYNKVKAIEYFKETRALLIAKLKIETNVSNNSGFKVIFEK